MTTGSAARAGARAHPASGAVPRHVAIIMDGNGRWAASRGLPRVAGHRAGAEAVRKTLRAAAEAGKVATVFAVGGAFMLMLGTGLGEWSHLSFTTKTSVAFVYLTLLGSVVAFAAYSYALKHLDVAVVSLYTYVNPIIAVALGTLIGGEPFALRMVVAAVIILAGMFIVGPGLRGNRTS